MPDRHNLALLADAALERLGDRPSLLVEGRWHTSGELNARSQRVAGGLVAVGVEPGDRVVLLMLNGPEVGVVSTAVWRAGAVVTPVIFLVSAPELHHILVDSGATVLVISAELAATAITAAAGAPALLRIVVAGDAPDGDSRAMPLADLERAEPVTCVARDDDDLAALLYTGGTTGRSKGVMLSHRNLWSSGRAAMEVAHVPGLTRSLVPLPLSHAYGILVTIAGMHAPEPGVAVVMRWFDPEGWLRLVQEQRIQRSALVPSMLQMLLAQPLEAYDLTSLRHISSGAAPLAPDVRAEFERRVPGVEVLEGYGCTESAGLATANAPGRRRVGTVGRAVPGVEIRVVDDGDRPLPPGGEGEICLRGPFVMQGYWHADDESAAALRDGFLHTGDIGRLDADGYLTIIDRKKDLIIRGGFNVYPRDVEEVLLAHPSVAAAAVVGRPDPRLGEEVVAVVELRPGAAATPDELVAHARGRLASTKYPREVRIVDRVPLTSVLKTDRKAVRRLVG